MVGFFQQFLEVFSELKGKKLYLSGESVRNTLNFHCSALMTFLLAVRGDVCAL